MKVTIVGGWDTARIKNKKWKLKLDKAKKDELKEFCRTLGRSLAMKRHTVFVGSDDKDKSVDPYVVEGMLQQLAKQNSPERLIRPIQGIDSNKDLYSDERKGKSGRFFLPFAPPCAERWPRAAAKIVSIQEADVVITIAGLRDTYIAGIAALVAKKTLVPIGVYGGASRELLDALKSLGGNTKLSSEWNRLYQSSLDDDFVKTVLCLGGLDQTRVFFGYCSLAKTTALKIYNYMHKELQLNVTDWATDFESGEVILSQIQAAARSCKYGVFLFTPDDKIVAESGDYKVPRANVIFEAGYFMNSHGPERTVIIVQEGTTVPADYSGHIYPSLKKGDGISPIKERLRKIFKEDLLQFPSKEH